MSERSVHVMTHLKKLALAIVVLVLAMPAFAGASEDQQPSDPTLLASGLSGTIGSTIGPDGALYVPEGTLGQITRIDRRNGETTTYASGLPPAPFGGAIDVAFIDNTAYALVTLVAPDHTVGIYRIDNTETSTVIADLGAFSVAHPPPYPIDVPTGLQYALHPVDDGFLVTDGHHNRVLHVTLDGHIDELATFGNVVPTGLATTDSSVFVAQAGPVPHTPETGKVVSLSLDDPAAARDVATGYSLIVDVEFGPHGILYALSQGDSPGDVPPATPAMPDRGKLLRVNYDGTFTVVADGLNLPTSLDFAGDNAYIVTLNGEIWKINHIAEPSHHRH
jgi:hypothetical protein